jgi:hypothetical protein
MSQTGPGVEPPPKHGMGCFAKGCLILAILTALLAIVCAVGIHRWARNHSLFHRGLLYLVKTNALSDTPVVIPRFRATEAEMEAVRERWERFDRAAHHGQPSVIELTAHELNTLIASNPDLAGKIFASIDGNRLRLQVSFRERRRKRSRSQMSFLASSRLYYNLDVLIDPHGPISLDHPQLDHITLNGQPLPNDLLDWTWNSRRLGDNLSDTREANRAGSIELRDEKLILHSRSD